MKKIGISFWTIYTLGFTVALPTFLYYNAEDLPNAGPMPGQSAATSFLYLGLGTLLWLIIIWLSARFLLNRVFFDKRKLLHAVKAGQPVIARILEKRVCNVIGSMEGLVLRLSFINLSGATIEADYELNDSRPPERRYEPGSSLEMRAYNDGKQVYLLPAGIQVSVRAFVVVAYIFLFLLILTVAVGYLLLSYRWESQGYGWRFLKLWHPWILVPAINLGTVFVGSLFLKFIGRLTSGNTGQPLRWALYGIRTKASVLRYEQTGTMVNDQPQIRFELVFTDQKGVRQQVQHKEIVSLVDLHHLHAGERDIVYLPENPREIMFYENISLS